MIGLALSVASATVLFFVLRNSRRLRLGLLSLVAAGIGGFARDTIQSGAACEIFGMIRVVSPPPIAGLEYVEVGVLLAAAVLAIIFPAKPKNDKE
ncbi:MAG: hypothetical protein SGI91_15240 [Alphaproteobacteria bacterium]|nr:hypothetical protein [Alphaproteobacteria bacterium]